jgi:hypothetical protein
MEHDMEEKKESKLKTFVRQHDRSLVIIAGFIVVGTFILKEIVREDLKDLKASLSEAESTFRTRGEFILLRKQVKNLAENVFSMPHKAGIAKEPAPTVMDEIVRLRDEGEAVSEEMDNISDIVEKLSLNSEERKNYEERKGEAAKASHAWEEILKSEIVPEEKRKRAVKTLAEAQNVEEGLLNATPEVIEKAREQETRKELTYAIVTWSSFVLFLIGSVMGLIGRIYGIKGAEAETI